MTLGPDTAAGATLPQAPDDGARALRGTARGGAVNLAGSLVSALAQLVTVLLVTRGVDRETAGSLFAGVSLLLVVAAVVQLGTDVSLVRHVSACRAVRRRADAVAVVKVSVVAVTAVATLPLAVVLLLPDRWVSEMLGGGDAAVAAVLLAGVPGVALHELFLAVTRGVGAMRPTVVLERVLRPTVQLVLVGAALAGVASAPLLAAAWVLSWWVVLPFSAVAGVRTLRGLEDGGEPTPATSSRSFWLFSATRAGSRACQVALQRGDILLVAALAGASAAAVYTAATRFLVLGQLVGTAVQQAAQPFFAGLHTVGDRAALGELLKKATVWSVALVWPAYVVMALCAVPLLSVFGAGYEAGASSLTVLSVAMLAATAAGPVDVVLQMAGRGGTSLLITFVALAVDVVGCLVLVPRLGIVGAAAAWAAAIVVRNVATVWAVRRSPGVTAWSPLLPRVAGQALVAAGALTAVAVVLDASLLVLSAAVLLSATLYALVLWRERGRYELDLVVRR